MSEPAARPDWYPEAGPAPCIDCGKEQPADFKSQRVLCAPCKKERWKRGGEKEAGCPSCERGDGGPRHVASPGCESGWRDHCSCGVCF